MQRRKQSNIKLRGHVAVSRICLAELAGRSIDECAVGIAFNAQDHDQFKVAFMGMERAYEVWNNLKFADTRDVYRNHITPCWRTYEMPGHSITFMNAQPRSQEKISLHQPSAHLKASHWKHLPVIPVDMHEKQRCPSNPAPDFQNPSPSFL